MTKRTIKLILEKILNDKIKKTEEENFIFKNYKIIFLEDGKIQIIKDENPHALLETEEDLFKYFIVYVSSYEGLVRFEELFLKEDELHYKELAYLQRIQRKRHKDTTIKDIYNQLMFSNKSPKILGKELDIEPNFIKKLKNHERKNILNKITSYFMEIKGKVLSFDEYQNLENKIDNYIIYWKNEKVKMKLYIIGSLVENCEGEGISIEEAYNNLKNNLEEFDIVLI